MAEPRPVLYLLHGEDEQARREVVQSLKARLGDATVAAMNYLRLEKQDARLDAWRDIALTAPFLASRRIVHLVNPAWPGKNQQQALLRLLENLPPTTAVIVEFEHPLKERHWLLAWATAHPEKAWVRRTERPKGPAMARWILQQAREEGGQITPQAAQVLADQVGDDTTLALQELRKLLAFVNYSRPVDVDDVLEVAVIASHPDIFRMVDALGRGDSRTALRELHDLLARTEPPLLWGMVVRQFRLLLLTRAALDQGIPPRNLPKALGVPPFVARKLAQQVGRFNLATLKRIHRALLNIDRQRKTGETDLVTALDTLFASLGAPGRARAASATRRP